MTDTPSSILLLRLQSTGSNTNLWGPYLNTAFSTVEQAAKGYQTLAVTGDATISWTNYATGNTGQCAHLKLTGSLTSAATLTFPSYQNRLAVYNNAGQTVTIKCSGGTGVAIPNGARVVIRCDGTDYVSDAATHLPNYISTLTNNGDIVVMATLQSAIATASGLTAPFILVDAGDATQGYLGAKLSSARANAAFAANGTTNKTAQITIQDLALIDGGLQTASFTAAVGTAYVAPTGGTITLPAATGSRRKIHIALYGSGVSTLSGTVNGQSSATIDGDNTWVLTDADATRGWV